MASRLIDKMLANPNVDARFQEQLALTHIIDADNVADFVLSHGNEMKYKTFHEELKSIPGLRLPFPQLFIQYKNPWGRNDEYGFWLEYFLDTGDIMVTMLGSIVYDEPLIAGTRLSINDDWQYAEDQDEPDYIDPYWEKNFYDAKGRGRGAGWFFFGQLRVALWTLAFMNCKNATLEPIEPNAAENKRRAKHGKLPLMRYHVLKIKPFGGRSDNEAQGGTHGSPALHIVRGHFVTYKDEAPMFGKLVGTWWKEQHIAGRKSNRVVVKDYEMDLTGAK